MAQRSRRNKRRRQANDAGRPANGQPANPNGSGAAPDRYQKYLPEWMRGANGAAPFRPARQRRNRPPRPAGGYTPGKSILGNPGLGDF